MKIRYLVVIVFLLLAACGKKGPLVPPESFVPAPITTLSVEQKENRFFVSWEAPGSDEGGRPLKELAGFRVFRREVLPPGEDCEECPTAYRLVKTVDLEYLKDVRVFGNRYVFAEGDLDSGRAYQYKVISFQKDGSESSASNRARRTMVAAPPAPRLKGVSTATGIVLEWESAQPAGAASIGFNLYRRRGDDVRTLVLVTPEPVRERRYEDQRLDRGATYFYSVREVAEAGGQVVEGAVSNEVSGALTSPAEDR
ncbi:MAG: fibronectin type III domain-containing protein [Desulfuromonadales bacterium]|nr:MAG: fibronectin type III domain-containing protein [Desulfuromonadales bacterium]